MWLFVNESRPHVSIGLICGKDKLEYKVGRVNCNVPGADDLSISKEHAIIRVEPTDDKKNSRPRVFVKDRKSTYGTYVGEEAIRSSGGSSQADRVRSNQEIEIFDGTRVRFGLQATIFR